MNHEPFVLEMIEIGQGELTIAGRSAGGRRMDGRRNERRPHGVSAFACG